MVCPVCPTVGLFGGYVGGYFGVAVPKRPELRIMSALITAGMILVTVVALKCLFGIAICDGNGDFSLRNIVQVGVITLPLGIVYSIGVNYLLNQLFPESSSSHCCCEREETNTQ